ncbi:MAG: hypothetical protein GX330_04870 [Bacteroidales bacterium]|nr:hypothetical protein [Bacteroidales bacterium]
MKLLKLIKKNNHPYFDNYVYVDNDNIYTISPEILLIKKKPKELEHLNGIYDRNLFINEIYKDRNNPEFMDNLLNDIPKYQTNHNDWEEEMVLNKKTIKEIERISKFRLKKGELSNQKGVGYYKKNFIATNAHYATWLHKPTEEINEHSIVIPIEAINILKKQNKAVLSTLLLLSKESIKEGGKLIQTFSKYIRFTFNDYTMYVRCGEITFPNLYGIMLERRHDKFYYFTLNKKELKNYVDKVHKVRKITKGENSIIEFKEVIESDSTYISCSYLDENDNIKTSKLFNPYSIINNIKKDIYVNFDVVLLKLILETIKDENVTFKGVAPIRAHYINDKYLLMPMR